MVKEITILTNRLLLKR